MRPKSMVLILIALGCGLIASIGISQVMERNGTGETKLATAQIYVATVDMMAGEELNASKIKLEEWPVDKIPEGAIKSPEQLDGKSPIQPMYAGEPLLIAKLADRDKIQGTARKIRPGFRVKSIAVDAASAVSGLIMPGDHVDVTVFTRGQGNQGDKAQTVLENIEVFAVNEQIHRDLDSAGNSIQARTVSLLVTPEQSERLMYFSQIGVMSLQLRHPDEITQSQPKNKTEPAVVDEPAINLDMIKSLIPEPTTTVSVPAEIEALPPAEPLHRMQVIQGGSGNVEEWTWDDVNTLPRELRAAQSAETEASGLPGGISLEEMVEATEPKAPPAPPLAPGASKQTK